MSMWDALKWIEAVNAKRDEEARIAYEKELECKIKFIGYDEDDEDARLTALFGGENDVPVSNRFRSVEED